MKLRPVTFAVALFLSLPVAFAQTTDNGRKAGHEERRIGHQACREQCRARRK